MNPKFFRIAATKTTDPAALGMLAGLENLAQELATAEASFPERINANKAKRGEKSTKLPRRKAEELKELEQDQIDIDQQVCEDFLKADTPSQIVASVSYALKQDIPTAKKFLKHYHPDDLPLGEEIFNLKEQLLEMVDAFLKRYPENDG